LFSSSSRFSPRLSSLVLWNGGCRVVRAQLCEHARDTTPAFVVSGVCGVLSYAMLVAYRHDGIVVHTTHCSSLMATAFLLEHCVLSITL
jgi:hypothetical protein